MTMLTTGFTGAVFAFGLSGPAPQPVAGGEVVGVCGFPTVVRMQGNCSGTLVHPQVVLYASHCGTGSTNVLVGEDAATATPVAVDQCMLHPLATGEPGGTDIAMCTLVDPVDVPIAPILMGCEAAWLQVGRMVTSVGFGNAPDGPAGIKRAVTFPVTAIFEASNVVQAGGPGQTLCSGDSGGGTFVQLFDGTWRAFGVNSAVLGTPCSDGDAVLAGMAAAVPWIEQTTGFDVTPCHDVDGNWDPGPACGDIPFDPAPGGGAWPACEFGPLQLAGSSCGAPAFGPDDLAAPQVSIVTPTDGATFDLDPVLELADVEITIEVDDADGWGVASTRLQIDGVDVGGSLDDFPPFEVPALQFAEGVYSLQVVAADWAGNEATSAQVEIIVGDPALGDTGGSTGETTGDGGDTSPDPDDGGGDGTTGTSPGGSTGDVGGSTSGALDGTSDPGGCGCRAPGPRGELPWRWLLAACVAVRRRRP
jgi:hypothetical protein